MLMMKVIFAGVVAVGVGLCFAVGCAVGAHL